MAKSLVTTLKLQKPDIMLYSASYETDKDQRKFIERTKRIIRNSMEYKDYVKYLRENCDMDKCAFFQKIRKSKDNKVRIEIHHEPFTLDDIVRTVINKQMDEGVPLNDLNVADEVMYLHYSNMVGLVPLSKTVHEMVHADTNKIFVPLNMCYGDYREFLNQYADFIEEDIMDRLEAKIEMTRNVTEDDFAALEAAFEYLDVEDVDLPEKVELENSNVA